MVGVKKKTIFINYDMIAEPQKLANEFFIRRKELNQ